MRVSEERAADALVTFEKLVAQGKKPVTAMRRVLQSAENTHLTRHYEIVSSIQTENDLIQKVYYVLAAYPYEGGHRVYMERCVWCRMNYLDWELYGEGKPCEGTELAAEWDHDRWPLEAIDAARKAKAEKATSGLSFMGAEHDG